jgi:hypothetical protein
VGAIDDYCAASEANDIGGLLKTLTPDVELISPLSGRLLFRGRDDLGVLLGAIYGTLKGLSWSTQLNDGSTGFVIGHARAGPFRIDDAMVFELSRDGLIMRIPPAPTPVARDDGLRAATWTKDRASSSRGVGRNPPRPGYRGMTYPRAGRPAARTWLDLARPTNRRLGLLSARPARSFSPPGDWSK